MGLFAVDLSYCHNYGFISACVHVSSVILRPAAGPGDNAGQFIGTQPVPPFQPEPENTEPVPAREHRKTSPRTTHQQRLPCHGFPSAGSPGAFLNPPSGPGILPGASSLSESPKGVSPPPESPRGGFPSPESPEGGPPLT